MDNLELDRVIQYYIFFLNNKPTSKKVLMLAKEFISLVFTKYNKYNFNIDSEFVFFNTTKRKDHEIFFEHVYNICVYQKKKLMLSRIISVNFAGIWKYGSSLNLLKNFRKKISILDKLVLSLKLLHIIDFRESIKSIKCKSLVVFSDVQPLEDVIVRFMNTKGTVTITLQHGMYIDYVSHQNINMLNYLNVPSKYVLCWGKQTARLFEKYNPEIETFICGKPTIKARSIVSGIRAIGVVLDIPMFIEYNNKLLDIAQTYAFQNNYEVHLRLHPNDKLNNYSFSSKVTPTKDIDNCEFIIAHTTTMIYEYLARGKKVYKLKSDIPSNKFSENLKFSNADELFKLVEQDYDFENEAINFIAFIDSSSSEKYKEFFSYIHCLNDDRVIKC